MLCSSHSQPPRTSLPLSEQHGGSMAGAVCAARRDCPLHFVGEHIAEYPIWHALGGERVTQTYRHKLQFPYDPHPRCPIRVHWVVIVPLVRHGPLSSDASRRRSPCGARAPLEAKRLWRRAVPPSPHTSLCEACAAAFLRPNHCLLPREVRLGGELCKNFLTIYLRHITPKHLEELGGRIDRDFCVSKAPG